MNAPSTSVAGARQSPEGASLRERWESFFSSFWRPVDGGFLGALRILFGVAMCVSMVRFIAYGWVERFFVQPRLHFKYWGLSWVEPLSASGMQTLFAALVVLSACMTIGLAYRLCAGLFTLGLIYFQLIDVSTYLNHYYLAALLSLLLTVSPAGRIWSVDAWVWRRIRRERRTRTSEQVATFWLWLFRFQIGLVYLSAGLAKLNSDWLLHAQPLRIWLSANTHLPVLGPLFTVEGVPLAMSWAGFLFDTTIVGFLSWKKSRPFAYVVVLVFHTLTRVLFPIGMFPIIMTLAALVFFEPDWPRRTLSWVGRLPALGAIGRWAALPSAIVADVNSQWRASPALRRGGFAVAAVYCALQCALPLRGLAYGGNVMWHEQGMRFSWRVMLRAKGGSASFIVRERGSDRRVIVEPRRYLTDLQEAEMVSQPDLILQLARVIQRDYEARGWMDVEVRVDTRVSLNGRRSMALIDPRRDLTQLSDGLSRFEWITQAPSEAPRHTRPVL